jgi:hypothetical protein
MNLLEMLNEDLNTDSNSNERPGFTKFEVGDTLITVLAIGTPRWTHFIKSAGKLTVNCPGQNCPVCSIIRAAKKNDQKTDHKSTKKYGMLVYNHNSGELEILDQKITFIRNFQSMLQELKEDAAEAIMEENQELTKEEAMEKVDTSVYDPTQFVTRIRRKGTGMNDTEYSFKKAPKSNQKPTPEDIVEKANELNINELWLVLDNDQLKQLLAGKTLKEIFNPEEADEESDGLGVDFTK